MNRFLLVGALVALSLSAIAQNLPDPQETLARMTIESGQLREALGNTSLQLLAAQKALKEAEKERDDLKAKYEPDKKP